MTPAEIQAVQEAWKVDPACGFRMPLVWPSDAQIEQRLHHRLLERGAWVERWNPETYYVCTRDDGSSVAKSDSLIEAMARALIALAKESPDA